jgi:hypothetical protein
LNGCSHGFVQAPVETDEVAACPEREPVEIDPGDPAAHRNEYLAVHGPVLRGERPSLDRSMDIKIDR